MENLKTSEQLLLLQQVGGPGQPVDLNCDINIIEQAKH